MVSVEKSSVEDMQEVAAENMRVNFNSHIFFDDHLRALRNKCTANVK